LIDDEQSFLEPLADALEYEGYRVLKARTADEAFEILENERIDLVTIDIMLSPGTAFDEKVDSHSTGLLLCQEIREWWPRIDAFCISVISEPEIIRKIEAMGIRFLGKGETPLRTVLDMLRSRLTGIAYSTDRKRKDLQDGGSRQENNRGEE
jgi:CheY-like chemotaxis protein